MNLTKIPSKSFYYKAKDEIGYNLFELISAHGGYIAGGAIRAWFADEKIEDYDIFFDSQGDLYQFLIELFDTEEEFLSSKSLGEGYSEHYKVVFNSVNAISIVNIKTDVEIQFIKALGRQLSIEKQIKSFDFSVCSAGYDIGKNEFVVHPLFFDDLKDKRIRVMQNESEMLYPLAEIERIARYSRKGYKIKGIDIVYVILFIAERMKKVKTYDDFKHEINGMDIVLIDGVLEEAKIDGKEDFDGMNLFGRIQEYLETQDNAE